MLLVLIRNASQHMFFMENWRKLSFNHPYLVFWQVILLVLLCGDSNHNFRDAPLASSLNERQKNQILTLIFTFYFRIISVHKLLWLGKTCVNYAAQKSC